jgi:signal transduction histidine kinase
VITGSVEGYRAAYRPRPFELAAPAGPVWIEGSPDAFAQLLDKLVDNANDFAPAGSAIRVALEVRGRSAILSVENEGPQLPLATRARLFDSMVTLREPGHAEAGDGAHLGLGLYIVRLVAEAHGGDVTAENLEPRGARFEVRVPLP